MTHRHASKQHGCTPTQRFSRLRLTLPRPTRRLVNTCLFQSRTHLAVGADPSRVFRGVAAAARLSTLVLALPCEGPGAAAYRAYLREFRGEVCAPCVAVGSVALTDTRRPAPGVPHFMPLELLHCGPFDSVSLFGVFETIGAPLSETAQPVFDRFLPALRDGGALFGEVTLPSAAQLGSRSLTSPQNVSRNVSQMVSCGKGWRQQSDTETLAALADALEHTCKWFRLEPRGDAATFCGYK